MVSNDNGAITIWTRVPLELIRYVPFIGDGLHVLSDKTEIGTIYDSSGNSGRNTRITLDSYAHEILLGLVRQKYKRRQIVLAALLNCPQYVRRDCG